MDNPGLELGADKAGGSSSSSSSRHHPAIMAANVSPSQVAVTAPQDTARPQHGGSTLKDDPRSSSPPGMSREQEQQRWEAFLRHWKSGLALALGYLLALLAFICFFHLRRLPKLAYPVINNLLDWRKDFVPRVWWPEGATLVLLLWGALYLRKLLLLVLQASTRGQAVYRPQPSLHNTKGTKCGAWLGFVEVSYHLAIGVWTGWANNVYSGYIITEPLLVILGLVLFVTGEAVQVGGVIYHLVRRCPEGQYFISAKYACELLTWLGFALVSFTLPACVIVGCRLVLLVYLVRCSTRPTCCC